MENIFWIVIAPLALIAFFYWPGRLILRSLTGGRYPPANWNHNIEFVALIGLAIFIALLTIYHSS